MKAEGRRGAILGLVLLVSALVWVLVLTTLVTASFQHAVAIASRDRSSALDVAHHLVDQRRPIWDAWLAGGLPEPPADESEEHDSCSWRIALVASPREHVRATVDVLLGRAQVRVDATAYAP